MKNKTKVAFYATIPVLTLGLFGAGIASAHGPGGFGFGGFGGNLTPDQLAANQQTMFQNEANLLGISVDEVKTVWSQGKTLQDLAKEHNITKDQLQQKMKDAAAARLKAQLQTLVDKGVITQAQADARLKFMQGSAAKMHDREGKGFGRGHHFDF